MNTPLAALLFLPDGTAQGLYTEAIDLSALGRLTVRRASSIEFDNATQAWWVRLPKLGRVYCSPSRATCLEWEQQHFHAEGLNAVPA
jgi:hypothetical protein